MNKKLFTYLAGCITLFLVSCAHSPDLIMDKVSIYTDPDLNNNSATAVDLVIVYDEDLVKHIGSMSACTYFASQQQLLLDHPTLLDIWHWELVPGQNIKNFSPPHDKGRAFAAFVFANYLGSGNHRLRVTPDGVVSVLLTKDHLKDLSGASVTDVRHGKTVTESTLSKKQSKWATGVLDTPSVVRVVPRSGPVTPAAQPCVDKSSVCQTLQNSCSHTRSSASTIAVKPLAPLARTQPSCKCPTKR